MNRKSFITILITATIALTGIVPAAPAFAKSGDTDTTPKYTYQLKNDPQYDSLETTHAKEFAKGTKLTIFRTDNKTTSDCLTTDGDLIRLTVDQNAYPQKINGKYTEDELLEGAMFAG